MNTDQKANLIQLKNTRCTYSFQICFAKTAMPLSCIFEYIVFYSLHVCLLLHPSPFFLTSFMLNTWQITFNICLFLVNFHIWCFSLPLCDVNEHASPFSDFTQKTFPLRTGNPTIFGPLWHAMLLVTFCRQYNTLVLDLMDLNGPIGGPASPLEDVQLPQFGKGGKT